MSMFLEISPPAPLPKSPSACSVLQDLLHFHKSYLASRRISITSTNNIFLLRNLSEEIFVLKA